MDEKKQKQAALIAISLLLAYGFLRTPLSYNNTLGVYLSYIFIFLGTAPIYVIGHILFFKKHGRKILLQNIGILTAIHGCLWTILDLKAKNFQTPILILGPILALTGLLFIYLSRKTR